MSTPRFPEVFKVKVVKQISEGGHPRYHSGAPARRVNQ